MLVERHPFSEIALEGEEEKVADRNRRFAYEKKISAVFLEKSRFQ